MSVAAIHAKDYSAYSFKELVSEEHALVLKIHREFACEHNLGRSFSSLSAHESNAVLHITQNLYEILEEHNKRRDELKSTFLGISSEVYLKGVKGFLHFSFISAIALDFTSIFLDCTKAEYVEIASIACATSAVSLAILNKWGEDKLARNHKHLAQLENCSVDELSGVKRMNQFLNSFIKVVAFLEIQKAKKEEHSSSNSSNSDFTFHANIPFPQATLDFLTTQATAFGLKKTTKKELVGVCIARLRLVPDHILEKYTEENAETIRKAWIHQITKMARINYKPPMEAPPSVEIQISELAPSVNLDTLSLHTLIQLYKDEIIKFHEQFKLDVYLSNYTSIETNENLSDFGEQKIILDSFISKLKKLQEVIKNREKKYEQTHCIPCLSTKKKQDVLYGTKHIATVIFFGATSMSSVTDCVEGFGLRDAGKVVAMISGIFSMVMEGVCSWTTSRDLNNKLARASIIKADIADLEGFDQFNYFVTCFLTYVEKVRELKHFINHSNDNEFDDSFRQEVREKKQLVKNVLKQCERAIQSIENNFLEHLMRTNGIKLKEEWQTSLRTVYDNLKENLSLRFPQESKSIMKKVIISNTFSNNINFLKDTDEEFEMDGKQTTFDETISSDTESEEEFLYEDECTLTPEDEPTARSRRFCTII